MEMTIARDRWQMHLKTQGRYYHDMARQIEELHQRNDRVGAKEVCCCLQGLAELMEKARVNRLTRHQHILFRLGELIAFAEGAASLARRAARAAEGRLSEKAHMRFNADHLAALSRICAREAAMKMVSEGSRWIGGLLPETEIASLQQRLRMPEIFRAQTGLIRDMDYIADVLYERNTA
jgi:alkylation response protein AidB-like acyl-CoA dehydrogenase